MIAHSTPPGPESSFDGPASRIFPKFWLSGIMTPIHVEELCGRVRRADVQTQAAMGIGWPAPQVEEFIARFTAGTDRPERRKVPAGSWRMLMLHANHTSAADPCGFIVFRPTVTMDMPGGRISLFELRIDLAWIHPAFRRRGYSKHLVAHLFRYFDHYPVAARPRSVARTGVSARISVVNGSGSSRRIADSIGEYFELQREMFMNEEPGKPRGWPIRSVVLVDE